MKKIENWNTVLRHAWSYKFAILAALLSGVDASIQIWASFEPSKWIAIAAGVSAVAAAISRFIYQPKVSGHGSPAQE